MEAAKYFILFGVLLLAIALTPHILKRFPVTPSIIYLFFGLGLGHQGLQIFPVNVQQDGRLIEVLSELTVIISLFTVGLKLRIPFRNRSWFVPLSLGTFSMAVSIGIMALIAHYALNLGIGESILLGAILAPTDPVLASEAQLRSARDRDHLRFTLTTEGGLNDGTAFPFIMLGLGILGLEGSEWTFTQWLMKDLFWAISAGIGVGVLTGYLVSVLVNKIEVREKKAVYLEDFLTIGAIALSYGIAVSLKGYGFLAVFANAFVIRQFQLRTEKSDQETTDLPDDVLSFNEQLERIFEVVSVVTVGLLVDFDRFNLMYVLTALTLFFIARPVSVLLGALPFRMPWKERLLLSWAGVRGIGSLYYLFFAYNHGADQGFILLDATIMVIFLSIIIHGVSLKPLMRRWESRGNSTHARKKQVSVQ